jgi:hypothetical protein
MKKSIAVSVALLAVTSAFWLVIDLASFTGHAEAAPAPGLPKREYKVMEVQDVVGLVDNKLPKGTLGEAALRKDIADGMNKLGEEGWDLVAVEPAQTGHTEIYYFKRGR